VIEPIVVLLVLAAAPFAWVVVDMWRHNSAPSQAPTLVVEQVEPADAPALAA
jgi:hypothetical protein